MFVINANGQNSGYSCAEINNNYNPPMDGSVYSMYGCGVEATEDYNVRMCYLNCPVGCPSRICKLEISRTGRNGCCENSSSLLEYAKVNSFDTEIYFPNNINCDGGRPFLARKTFSFNYQAYCSNSCSPGIFEYTIPEDLFYSIATRKTFPEGLCIGKKMNGYLGLLVSDGSFTNSCGSCCTRTGYKDNGIEFYVGYGLLHTDGTVDYLDYCSFCTSSGCLECSLTGGVCDFGNCCGVIYTNGGRLCYSMTNPNINLLYGEKTTCGLTTQEGDRLILRMGNKASSGCIHLHMNSYCGAGSRPHCTVVQLYGGTQYCYGRCSCGPCYFRGGDVLDGHSTCNHTCQRGNIGCGINCINVKDCSPDNQLRFQGVQFSIE